MQAQVVETFSPAEEDEEDEGDKKQLQLIMAIKAEGAHNHDSEALKWSIDTLDAIGVTPEVLTADTAYGGDNNVRYAESHGTNLISPVPGNKVDESRDSSPLTSDIEGNEESSAKEVSEGETNSESVSLADFERDSEGKITRCPMGQAVQTSVNRKGTGFISSFEINACRNCSRKDKCPVNIGKRKASICYTLKNLRIADRRKQR